MYCNQCGHQNPAGARFCSSCGSSLDQPRGGGDETTTLVPVTGNEPPEAPDADDAGDLTAGQALLIVKRGPNAGSRFVLDGVAVSAGRSPDSDIFLDDITVSRRHARFEPAANGYEVRDVGSLNGTYLNRQRIDRSPLVHGDEVQIGKFKLVYLTGGRS